MPEQRDLTTTQKISYTLLGALIGGALAYAALKPGDDPDRPPIIVRNGSVTVGEPDNASVHGEMKKTGPKAWYHDHQYNGPGRLHAYVFGVSGTSCGSGGINYVTNVQKATFTYSIGGAPYTFDVLHRGQRVEVDVSTGDDLEPTTYPYRAKVPQDSAKLTRVVLSRPGGSETCEFGEGNAGVIFTQHKK
jgi:hypothetical protein